MHELVYIWINYFWASLKGNGPEAVVQTVVYGGIGILLIPVARRFIRNEAKKLHSEITGVEHEAEKLLLDVLKPARWVWTQVKKLVRRVRGTKQQPPPSSTNAHPPTTLSA